MSRVLSSCVALLTVLGLAAPALAFQILTPASRPCHERIVLGAVEAIDAPWSSDEDTDVSEVVHELMEKAEGVGIPRGKRTQAFIDDVVRQYDIQAATPAEKWVFASFVAGVRQPDTRGLSVVRFNNARETHLADEGQAEHSLRRSYDDFSAGNLAAIDNIRAGLHLRFEQSRARWRNGEHVLRATWTLPHYGEFDVWVFAPAFDMGHMTHTLQDSYAHVLRDDDFRVLSIGNFVDTQHGNLSEDRDGLGHSERMDHCSMSDPFDAMRVREAREASARWILMVAQGYELEDAEGHMDPLLDEIYDLREGCDTSNDFCGTSWLEEARKEVTEPVKLWFCSAAPSVPVPSGWRWLSAAGLRMR